MDRVGLVAFLVLFVQAAYAEDESQKNGHASRGQILMDEVMIVPIDLKNIATYPADHPDEFKAALLVVGALVLLDKPITRFYQNKIETPLGGFSLPASPIQKWGGGQITSGADGWLLLGVGGTYMGGVLVNDELAQQTGLRATRAIAYSYVISQLLLKSITGRKRPISWSAGNKPDGVYTDDPYQFGHIHMPSTDAEQYGTSMPSFHFTMFFAVAKVYQRAYDDYWAPYSLLTVGLVSNIRGHKHWVSDMVAGALVGTAIGSVVSEGEEHGGMHIAPFLDGKSVGLQVSANF